MKNLTRHTSISGKKVFEQKVTEGTIYIEVNHTLIVGTYFVKFNNKILKLVIL